MQDTFDPKIDSPTQSADAEPAQTSEAISAPGRHSGHIDSESPSDSERTASGPRASRSAADSSHAAPSRDARSTGAGGTAGRLSAAATDVIEARGDSDGGPAFMVGVRGAFTSPFPKPIPPKFYRIGEIVDFSGLSRQTIHNYTTMGLLRESRWTAGGHRLYDESTFERLNKIAELKAQRRSLAYIRRHFAGLDGEMDRRDGPAM